MTISMLLQVELFHSFLWLSNSLLISIYHVLVYSSVSGHLGFFLNVLAVANSAAVNIGVHVSFRIMVFSGYMPKSGIADYLKALFFVFKGSSILFSVVALSVYIPTKSVGSFSFLHTFSSIFCF